MLLTLALAFAAPPTAPAGPLATYERAVADTTRAVTEAVPRLVTCPRPAASKLVLKVDLTKGAAVTAVGLQPGRSEKVSAPCVEKVVQDVFSRARPAVGTEAAVVLDYTAGVRLDGDVALLGALPDDAVEAGIRARMGGIAQCYVDGLAESPALAGELLVGFMVLPDGRAVAPEVKRTALWNPDVEACVLREVAQARFPAPESGAVVRVTYPFTFAPPE